MATLASQIDFAVIGGTGFYGLEELENPTRHAVETPFGSPSADIVAGLWAGRQMAFLARHGKGHALAPHRVNYRANLWALHELGARRVIGINTVGGIRADMAPRTLAVPDQLIDYTSGRASSFCDVPDAREVRHVDFSEPYAGVLRSALLEAAAAEGLAVVDGGCYGATQGPRLETCAEIARMRRDGCDLVGMTGMPEAVLARELDIEYACLALVANWAAGCDPDGAPQIRLDAIMANVSAAADDVARILRQLR